MDRLRGTLERLKPGRNPPADTMAVRGKSPEHEMPESRLSPRELRSVCPVPENTRGLRVLKDTLGSSVDIIFVHGLKGDSRGSWLHKTSGVHWPTDLLPRDVPAARVLAFGYDAEFLQLFSVGKGTLRNHANTLVSDYGALRHQDDIPVATNSTDATTGQPHKREAKLDQKKKQCRRKVVFVAHSLGGLVVKKALCISSEFNGGAERLLDSDTVGVCFLGTPHMGSDLADLGSMALKFLKLFGERRMNPGILKLLEPGSEVLADVHGSFAHWLRRNAGSCLISCFFEEYATPHVGTVVSQKSAVIEGYPQLPIPSHHKDMIKFSKQEDVGYERLLGQISTMVMQSQNNDPHAGAKEQPPMMTRPILGHEECLRALSFADMDKRYLGIPRAAEDTCEWLANHLVYKSWVASESGVLWLLGHPGTGKSTLMKYAVQKSRQTSNSLRNEPLVLSFFFYDLGSELQKSIEGMLRTMLAQIMQAVPSMSESIIDAYNSLDKNSLQALGLSSSTKSIWTSTSLMQLFEESVARILPQKDVYLFIDALDECRSAGEGMTDTTDEARALVKDLRRILQKLSTSPYRFRICYSCRHYPHIASINDGSKIFAEKENLRDIKEYVTQELSSAIAHCDSTFLRTLVTGISDRADGSFQWVRLITKEVIKLYLAGNNRRQIADRIRDLHQDLSNLYGSVLTSIKPEDRDRARRLFEWACFAAAPLTTRALRSMMNIDPMKRPQSLKDMENIPDFIEDDSQMQRLVISLSGGLAMLTKARVNHSPVRPEGVRAAPAKSNALIGHSPADINVSWTEQLEDSDCLFLIHQSVKDYMLTDGFQILYGFPISRQAIQVNAYQHMSISLMYLLTMQEFVATQRRVYSQYSPGVAQQVARFWTTRMSFADIFAANGHSWQSIEFLHFFEKLHDPRFTRLHTPDHDMALLRQLVSHMKFPDPTHREALLAEIHSRMEWQIQLHQHGMTTLSTVDIFIYTHEAKQRSHDKAEASLISATPNAALQDPLTCVMALEFASSLDLPLIFEHVLSFIDRVDCPVRQTYLNIAAETGSQKVAEFLLGNCQASFGPERFEDSDALVKAMRNRHLEMALLLIAHGANIHQRDDDMRTPLHWAAWHGKQAMHVCRMLLENGADADCADKKGLTPLMYAARGACCEVFSLLLGYLPDTNAVGRYGDSVMSQAIIGGSVSIMQKLISGHAVSLGQKSIYNACQVALRHDSADFCRLIIQHKGFQHMASMEINAASAACSSASSCLKLFLDVHCQDINDTRFRGLNPLCWAVTRGNVAIARTLLRRPNINVNYIVCGRTALTIAVQQSETDQSIEVARLLLQDVKADPNMKLGGHVALHVAICHHGPSVMVKGLVEEPWCHRPSEFVRLLLEHPKTDSNARDKQGRTPLAFAAYSGNSGIAQQLLDHDPSQVNLKSHNGRSPLSWATSLEVLRSNVPLYGQLWTRIIDVLLENSNTDVNSVDIKGRTPLDWAIRSLKLAEKKYKTLARDGNDYRYYWGEDGRSDEDESSEEESSEDGVKVEDESSQSNTKDKAPGQSSENIYDLIATEELQARRLVIEKLRVQAALCGDCVRFRSQDNSDALPEPNIEATEEEDTLKATKSARSWKKRLSRGWFR